MNSSKNISRSLLHFFRTTLFGLIALIIFTGCAATRSDISGKFNQPAQKNSSAEKVSVFFHFKNLSQQHGFDSIPKLHNSGIKDFDNLFRDALPELGNISLYNTFYESPQDVNNLKRRQDLEAFKNSHDYTIEITFLEESSFKQQSFSGTVSLLSLTVIPVPYSWDYSITAEVRKKSGETRSFQRKATLNNWVETLLIFAYPFYPLEGKREEIYSESMHDIFRQIESEKILRK